MCTWNLVSELTVYIISHVKKIKLGWCHTGCVKGNGLILVREDLGIGFVYICSHDVSCNLYTIKNILITRKLYI